MPCAIASRWWLRLWFRGGGISIVNVRDGANREIGVPGMILRGAPDRRGLVDSWWVGARCCTDIAAGEIQKPHT
jgi:hypothetical protein